MKRINRRVLQSGYKLFCLGALMMGAAAFLALTPWVSFEVVVQLVLVGAMVTLIGGTLCWVEDTKRP